MPRMPSGPKKRESTTGWSCQSQACGCCGLMRPNSVNIWPNSTCKPLLLEAEGQHARGDERLLELEARLALGIEEVDQVDLAIEVRIDGAEQRQLQVGEIEAAPAPGRGRRPGAARARRPPPTRSPRSTARPPRRRAAGGARRRRRVSPRAGRRSPPATAQPAGRRRCALPLRRHARLLRRRARCAPRPRASRGARAARGSPRGRPSGARDRPPPRCGPRKRERERERETSTHGSPDASDMTSGARPRVGRAESCERDVGVGQTIRVGGARAGGVSARGADGNAPGSGSGAAAGAAPWRSGCASIASASSVARAWHAAQSSQASLPAPRVLSPERRGAEARARALALVDVRVREQDAIDARQQPEREEQRRKPSAGDAHRDRRL